MSARCCRIVSIVFFTSGIALLVLGLVLKFVVFPNILEDAIIENVELTDGSKQLDRFVDLPFPVNFKLYIWTVKNENEVLLGEKPQMEQIGPYVFKETRKKQLDLTTRDTVTYYESWSFQFDQEASVNVSDRDEVRVLNAPLLAVIQQLEDVPLPFKTPIEEIVDEIFEDSNLFVPVRVRDYVFDGVKMCDPDRTKSIASKLVCLSVMLLRQKLITFLPDRSMLFSLLSYKTLLDGPFVVNRGTKEQDKMGLITRFGGKEYLDVWEGKKSECNLVRGHYSVFPPFMQRDTTLKVFSTDICKSAKINYIKDTEFKGIDAYRFQTNETSFSGPQDECLCINRTKDIDGTFNCFSNSVVDLFNCLRGAPVVLSYPHLMFAEDKYTEVVDGINSNYTDEHATFIDFEPNLGIPLRGAIRIQFNVISRPMSYKESVIQTTEHLKPALMPILWIEDSFELTDELIDEINDELISKLDLIEIASWTIIGVSIGIALLSVAVLVCIKVHTKREHE